MKCTALRLGLEERRVILTVTARPFRFRSRAVPRARAAARGGRSIRPMIELRHGVVAARQSIVAATAPVSGTINVS